MRNLLISFSYGCQSICVIVMAKVPACILRSSCSKSCIKMVWWRMRVSSMAFALVAQSVACFSSVLEKWGFPIWSKGRKRCGKCCCVKSRLCEFIYFGAEVVIIITLVIYLQYFQISAHFPFPVANRIRLKNRVKCLSMFYCMLLLFICKPQHD